MDEKLEIKETKEAVIGINVLSIYLIGLLKDGLQVADLVSFIGKLQSDEAFKQKLADAVDKIGQVPAEAKDLDLVESMELAMLQLSYIPKWVEAFKKG